VSDDSGLPSWTIAHSSSRGLGVGKAREPGAQRIDIVAGGNLRGTAQRAVVAVRAGEPVGQIPYIERIQWTRHEE
jgi:hypothetical protein